MDAANLLTKRTALLFAFALLTSAVASAQQFTATPPSLTLSGATPGSLQITATAAGIPYTATASYANGDPHWLCFNNTPDSVTGQAGGAPLNVTVACAPENVGPSFTGTHTASITISGTGVPSIMVPVSYTVGSGGTGGTTSSITATPSTITSMVGFGGSTGALTVFLATTSASPINFTLAPSPVSWATWSTQAGGSAGTVSSGQGALLSVFLSGAGQLQPSALTTTLTVSTGTGSLTIPVTLNNGVNGSGTGSTGSLTVSPTTIPWSYSTSNSGLFPNPVTLSLFSTNGAINYTANATSSNNWLLINGGFNTSGVVGSTPLTLAPSSNLAALQPGTYSGTVNINGSDGSTAVVTVTATINGSNSGQLTISPNPITLSAALNGSIAQASVTIISQVSGTLSANASGSGISLSVPNANVTAGVATTVTVFGSPAGLTTGTYTGALNVTVAGSSAGAQITFVVGGGSGGTTSGAAPSQLNFYYEPNTSMPSFQTQQIYLSGSGSYSITSSTASSVVNWLTVLSGSSGTLPATLSVGASSSGLAAGNYTGQLTITNTSTGTTSAVNVTLLVEGISTLYASPGDWVFNYVANSSSVTQSQGITIQASDGISIPISATVTNAGSTPWLTVFGGGNTPQALTVSANATSLANGVYTGSINVSGGNNTLTVPIVLVVTGSTSGGTGNLTLGASSLTLQGQVNGSAVAQTLSVTANTSTAFSVSSQASYNGINWLSVSPTGASTTPANLTITANPAGLPAGDYVGSVFLTANGITQTVNVTLILGGTGSNAVTVTANGGTSTSPTLTFTASALNATVPTQTLSVASASGASAASFTVAASTTTGGSWIALNTAAGTTYQTPLTITVTPNTAGLAAGTYNGSVIITPAGGTAITVPVTLTIAGQPTIAVSTTSLSFTYQAGGATPNTQSVQVTVTNGTSAPFTATAASTPSGWLVVTPTSGTAPGALTVSVVPTALTSAGTYTGTITVAGGSGATGAATINVSITVTVPLPTVTAVVNAASFINEPISPGEIITIGGTNIGPATPASLTLSNNVVTTTLGGVQVLINGFAAPLTYVSATQINCVVPYEIAGILNPTVLVKFVGQSSNGFTVNAAATAPGIFTANGSGTGPGAILNADYGSNASTAAARGSVVQVFLTGEGQTSPVGVDGKVTAAPYPTPLLPIAVMVGGQAATYQFAGEAPGLVSGVMQLNVVIPSTLTATGNVPLSVAIGSATTQGGVTVNIK
jgi:uncharacterized protein (TIGR03437 family)